MAESTSVPPLHDISTSTTALPAHRRVKISRGARHQIEESTGIMAGGATASGLQALLTPTLATQVGPTTLSHFGSTTNVARITIPLPAVLATATLMSKGSLTATSPLTKEDLQKTPPTMMIDTEWFSVDAYPTVIRRYLASGFNFDLKPSDPGSVVKDTQIFLRSAYANLDNVGLNIKIADAFKKLFDEILDTDTEGGVGRPDHPYEESDLVANVYQVAAYVISKLLWNAKATNPLRDYPEVTYPGVIMASYVGRLTRYYTDLSKIMKLDDPKSPKPYLPVGGRETQVDESLIKHLGDRKYKPVHLLSYAVINIPLLTAQLRIAADYATGRKTDTKNCSPMTYKALQDAALNVKGLDEKTIVNNIYIMIPPSDNPLSDQIKDTRCSYFLGLIQNTIGPLDVSKSVPGGAPGIEPLPPSK